MRFGQPRTICLALNSASDTAKHSPLTGLYLLSTGLVNLPPARISFHPPWQQSGRRSVHSHHFFIKKNPNPCLLQSVARQVGLEISKLLTPSCTASTIFSLAASNSLFSASFHSKASQVSCPSMCLKADMYVRGHGEGVRDLVQHAKEGPCLC